MIKLEHLTDNSAFFLISGEYSLGRKDCTLLLPTDKSVSRSHATLTVNVANDEKLQLSVKDLNSAFGTFINNVKLHGLFV